MVYAYSCGIETNVKNMSVINNYATCDIDAKKRLWQDVILMKQTWAFNLWCMAIELNAIRKTGKERYEFPSGPIR